MKTVVIVLLILTATVVFVFFRSSRYLKMRLEWLKDDLQSIPNSRESLSLITEISMLVSGDFNPQQKEKARELINKSLRFLRKSVPCYSESGEIPTWDQRNDSEFKCARCNEKEHCAFFH